MIEKFKEIFSYRELLYNLTVKELKLKYKNSVLGFLWSFFNPLMMLIVYTFAFKYVMRIKVPNFTVFILAGLLPWTFFQASVQGSTTSIINNGSLIKKVYFPREIIPLSIIFSNFISFLITLIVLIIAVIAFKIKVGLPILLVPAILILMLIFTIGLSLMLAALNVVYRDVSHFVEIVFMAWFYVTPIVYSLDLIPEKYRRILLLNPMTLVIESFRDVFMYDKLPKLSYILGIILYGVVFMVISHVIFSKREISFAEDI
jgi:ABC-2 type transport system permease protein